MGKGPNVKPRNILLKKGITLNLDNRPFRLHDPVKLEIKGGPRFGFGDIGGLIIESEGRIIRKGTKVEIVLGQGKGPSIFGKLSHSLEPVYEGTRVEGLRGSHVVTENILRVLKKGEK